MLFTSAFFAGLAIAVAGVGYLSIGGIAGAVLFAWGLITVVHMRVKLFTGMAGFYETDSELFQLGPMLIANICGCLFGALLFAGTPAIMQAATAIIEARIASGPVTCFLKSIGCGTIMTIAVKYAREKQFLPLLFGVPLFIICGFPHCIADAFYLLASSHFVDYLMIWFGTVLGNFIGCNLPRWFKLM